MSPYIDHGNRHLHGGTDPSLVAWESVGDPGAGATGPGVEIGTATSQTVTSAADKYSTPVTMIEFDIVFFESADSEGMLDWGTDPTKINIIQDGIYLIDGVGVWATASSGSTYRRVRTFGGGFYTEGKYQGDTTNTWVQDGCGFSYLTAGDFIQMEVTQCSGSSVQMTGARIGVQWIGTFDGILGARF